MRKVEQTIRDAEGAQWKKTDPELAARANSFAAQLQKAVDDLQAELTAAQEAGDDKKAAKLQDELKAKQAWLDQAMGGVKEFGG